MNQEQYIKAILKKLKCSNSKKQEIRRELEADIADALESGETLEELIKRMGEPSLAAEEFNNNFSKEELSKAKKKKVIIITSVILAVLVILFLAGFWAIPKSYPLEKSGTYTESEVIAQAEAVIAWFNEDDYDSLRACATERMKPFMTKESMDEAKSYIGGDWGTFLSYGNAYAVEVKQMGTSTAIVQIAATYENTAVTYTISFDQDLNLAGFYMR